MASRAKPLQFVGDARARLQEFPEGAQDDAGYALYRLQLGREPNDWKPMPAIGVGVGEIRLRDENGIFRIFYVAKFVEAVYVLHCFQKKTQKTDQRDLELGRKRFKALLEERNS
jgi:phage-related protein